MKKSQVLGNVIAVVVVPPVLIFHQTVSFTVKQQPSVDE